MNEFEWLRQMRDLNRPTAPRNDLWARIDAALDDAATSEVATPVPTAPARRHRTWALAASIAAVVVLAGGIVWHMHAIPHSETSVATINPNMDSTPWKPSDPRLAGAALELNAARLELQQAIQQAPDSPALQRLLQRTHAQQNQLRELEKQAG
ncbi:hypothetical protein [Dyella acidisoli]|uniref:Anti-sigma factor n=1 Tax=Dyella acidisoli TaxID=1867834 RepID=A0ABQ5XQ19_9GAMM|nr:hypothetical protein [Dyella acidisoli]GLQ92610.1 hypothetical protein GCM10007901_15610 [Dyella acidisoli]